MTANPPAGVGRASSVPPTARTRSRIPGMPNPPEGVTAGRAPVGASFSITRTAVSSHAPQRDPDRVRPGMPEHIRECLLANPVQGDLSGRGDGRPVGCVEAGYSRPRDPPSACARQGQARRQASAGAAPASGRMRCQGRHPGVATLPPVAASPRRRPGSRPRSWSAPEPSRWAIGPGCDARPRPGSR